MTTPMPASVPSMASLFPSERTAAEQALINRYKHLGATLACLTEVARDSDVAHPAVARWTARAIAATREMATATEPLITHLPAIIAALGDAADYRDDDGGWCAECHRTPGDQQCGDHARDQAIAAAYKTALHAITG